MKSIDPGQPLTLWLRENPTESHKPFRNAKLEQIHFVRDRLSMIVATDAADYARLGGEDVYNERCERVGWRGNGISVIGTHMTKSCLLPVYLIDAPARGWQVIMRHNFHDWKISLISEEPIPADVMRAVLTYTPIIPMWCEGFKEEWVFGPFETNAREITVELPDQFMVWTFFWELVGRKCTPGMTR